MKKILLILFLLIPFVYAVTVPSPGVFAPTPRAMFLYPGEKGEFIMNVDNTKSEYDSFCVFSIKGGESQFLMDLIPQRIEVKAGETNKISVDVTIPLDLAPGRYIEKICANCGLSKAICASCQTSTICDYVVDVTVLKSDKIVESKITPGEISFQLPEGVECYKDSDCDIVVYCPDGTTYKEWVCVRNKCQEVLYAEDPCIKSRDLSILEKISYFLKNFLERFF